MAEGDDRSLEEPGRASIGRRLAGVATAAGRLLLAALVETPLAVIRGAHTWVKRAEPWGILIVVIAFTLDFRDRVEERTVRAWQLLTTSAPGNSGKREALEYLNRQDGLCWGARCLLTLKERTPLVGIDLSPPGSGEPDGPYDDDGRGAFLMGAQLPWANLSNANLHRANLFNANFMQAYLEAADLGKAILSNANFVQANLRRANLEGARLEAAKLEAADLDGANLRNALFTFANLSGASFRQASFKGAYFYGAMLESADFEWAWFEGANLEGADFSTARGLTQKQLNLANGDKDTKIPEGLTRPEHWSE